MWNKYCKKLHHIVAIGRGASHIWKKILVREEIEHNIWWKVTTGNFSIWFDNWTKQGALYYLEGENDTAEELEVRDFITERQWNITMLGARLSEEIQEYIVQKIKTPNSMHQNDTPWWMANTQGSFTVKTAWELVRRRVESIRDFEEIWIKRLPFKINFFMWRVWRRRIATDDNLKRININIVSRCWCCEQFEEETMSHLFLTSSIANRLWKQFAIFAGLNIKGMHLQLLITTWWKLDGPTKLQVMYKAIPSIIMWTLWKRRNAKKHGERVCYTDLVWQVQDIIKKFMKVTYLWITGWSWTWPSIITKLREYIPKLQFIKVMWKLPNNHRLKCNTDGASRGNPGLSSYGFILRDNRGDLLYAKAQGIGMTTNTESEARAI
ncbi:hypothetical protein KY289_023668 [Solanum tuberosum]|nr:hypothetical protein KY289_023668 [Solanum tuberosum]